MRCCKLTYICTSFMSFSYNQDLLENGKSYTEYRQGLNQAILLPPANEAAEKLNHFTRKNVVLMDRYDHSYKVNGMLAKAVENAPKTTWIIIAEGWCGDAAFNVPLMVALEKLNPEKVNLKFYHRDSNPDLIDANLTDGGRSIPKVVMLNNEFEVVGNWGPRPQGLQALMKEWKSEGLQLKDIIPKVHEWYDNDATDSLQQELTAIVKNYSGN